MRRKVANEKEVLQFYTKLLRMEGGEKISDALKAAEFFVKYLGILDKVQSDDVRKVIIVDDIAKVKEELNAGHCVSEE